MKEFQTFSFFCPAGKENRAIELLQNLDCTESVGINISPLKKLVFDTDSEEPTYTEGFGIVGLALPHCIEKILKILSSEQIAGYSKETQILFFDEEIDEVPFSFSDAFNNEISTQAIFLNHFQDNEIEQYLDELFNDSPSKGFNDNLDDDVGQEYNGN